MKCKQAVELTDRYLEKRLESKMLEALQEHLNECLSCRYVFEERKELFVLLEAEAEIKAPSGLTDSIMEAVFKIEVPARVINNNCRRISYPVFRRLGVSMLLTAAIMIFSMFIPPEFGGAIDSFAAEKTNTITDKTNQLSDTITDFDKTIKLFFRNFNQTFERLKEV